MNHRRTFLTPFTFLAMLCLNAGILFERARAQEPAKPSTATPPENPAQIELLETKIRFEADGSSRKEVHARVRINSELGVRQFARLNFDYNRSFESIEIPLVHVTHPNGGTADILSSAITDNPHPAVVEARAYQDVRVKSVRILGLQPGDLLEYRVITSVSHHPLAPDFWLDHSFDRTGVVSQEIFELDLPASRKVQMHIDPAIPASTVEKDDQNQNGRLLYEWKRSNSAREKSEELSSAIDADLTVTSFPSWDRLSSRLADLVQPPDAGTGSWLIAPEVSEKARELTQSAKTPKDQIEAIYDFVSQKIVSVDLPLGSTGFRTRTDSEILSSGYANVEDRFKLFAALARPFGCPPTAFLSGAPETIENQVPRPTVFSHLVIRSAPDGKRTYWLDPAVQVAPFGAVPSALRGHRAFALGNKPPEDLATLDWEKIPVDLPFSSSQKVRVDATATAEGKLTAKVHYALRGDNELVLRVAFHQAPKEKWKDLAQVLSLSDGFRGQVSSVTASDPYATREPFTVDYEITMPKFVDWSKKPARIPALLPQVGLPDPPTKPIAGAKSPPIELGTPLEVAMSMMLQLPPGTTVQPPTGTSVQRDYATFASQYSTKGLTISASRHINFLLREIPADRAADYQAFLRAVQNDEAQDFTLEREATTPPNVKPLTVK